MLDAHAVESKEVLKSLLSFVKLAAAFNSADAVAAAEIKHHATFFKEDNRRVLFPLFLAGVDLECHTLEIAAKKEITRLIRGQTEEAIKKKCVTKPCSFLVPSLFVPSLFVS